MDFRDRLRTYGRLAPPDTMMDERREVLVFAIDDGEGEPTSVVEHVLPYALVICPSCQGRGSYVNPAIDAHGITGEEWDRDWDDEDRERYLSGGYDVTCDDCHGVRVVPEPVEPKENASAAHRAAWDAFWSWCEDESSYRAECEDERRMGC